MLFSLRPMPHALTRNAAVTGLTKIMRQVNGRRLATGADDRTRGVVLSACEPAHIIMLTNSGAAQLPTKQDAESLMA